MGKYFRVCRIRENPFFEDRVEIIGPRDDELYRILIVNDAARMAVEKLLTNPHYIVEELNGSRYIYPPGTFNECNALAGRLGEQASRYSRRK